MKDDIVFVLRYSTLSCLLVAELFSSLKDYKQQQKLVRIFYMNSCLNVVDKLSSFLFGYFASFCSKKIYIHLFQK